MPVQVIHKVDPWVRSPQHSIVERHQIGACSAVSDPRLESEMGVDQEGGDHLLGSKSRMTSSGMLKSSDRYTPLSSPCLIGCRLRSGPRQATARPLRVTMIFSPASARATSAAN